jgi:hypothetical protein
VPAIFLRRPEIGELAAVAGDPAPLSQVLKGGESGRGPGRNGPGSPALGNRPGRSCAQAHA